MTRAQLIDRVKSKIDELTPFDGGLTLVTAPGNIANNPVETYIDQFLNEAAKETLLEAPSHVLPLTAFETIVFDLTNQKATITISANYIRVGYIKFSSWHKAVYEAIYPGDADYAKQFNRWLRGGKARPSAVWINDNGTNKLICYGVTSNTGYDAKYVSIMNAEEVPDILQEALQWHCADMVLEVFEKEKASEQAYSRYLKALTLL